jgi:hypothetical protein
MTRVRVIVLCAATLGVFLQQRLELQGVGRFPAIGTNPINVKEHGAEGNGTTDDTKSLVDVFRDVCASGGGTIYFPSGTYIIDPGSSAIPICSNLLVYGTGTLRVKPDSGNYRYIFAPNRLGQATDNLTFAGLTIDQNTSSNTTGSISVDDTQSWQQVWQVSGGTNIHFEDLRLYVCGVNSLNVNGPTISGVYMARNHIVFQKRPGQAEFDNSTVYIDGDDFHVSDNTFTSSSRDAARTAIEIHTGSGSVAGNTISSYQAGMNLVNLQGASVASNHVRSAGQGISLWSTTNMNSVTVQGNTISLNQATRNTPTAWGIATFHLNGVNGSFSNLQISGNVVTFEAESAPRTIANWVNYGIGLQTLGNISNALVTGNQVIRAPVRGITVGIADSRYVTSRVSVRDNQIVDAGSNFSRGTSDYSAAIALQGNLTSIDVLHNRLDFLSSPMTGHYSYWSAESGFTFRDVIVAENYVTAAGAAPANGLTDSIIQAYPPQ